MLTRTRKVFWGTLASVLQIGIAIGLQIVLMPLILRTVGQETLGVYAIILQIIGYLALLDLGISTALGRSLSQATHEPVRYWELMNVGTQLLVVIGLVYAGFGTILAFTVGDLFHLSAPLAEQARAALILLAAWGLLRFPLSIFSIGLGAIQDLTVPPLLGAASNIARMVLSVAAVLSNQGLQGLIAASVFAEAWLATITFVRFHRLRPGFYANIGKSSPGTRAELMGFGLKALWGNLAGRVILFSDNLVVGSLYGPAATSVYYNTQTPISIPYSLVFRLADNASPGINELWSLREWSKLRDIFLRLQRLSLLLVAPVVVGGWFYLSATVRIWVGSAQFGGQWMTLWLVVFAALFTASHVPMQFVYAAGRIERFSQLVTVEAIINLTLSFILGGLLGPQGVALATMLAHIPTAAYLQTTVQNELRISVRQWARETLRPVVCASAPLTVAAAVLSALSPPADWQGLALHGIIIAGVYAAGVYAWGITQEERAVLLNFLSKSLT